MAARRDRHDHDGRRGHDRHEMSRHGSSTDQTPPLNKIFKGEVTCLKPFGAFVKIPGFYKNGLIHKSQLSKCNIGDPSEVVQLRDSVWCKVVSINDEGKIGLSMKVVHQGTGEDLDPNGVEMEQDERRRQTHVPFKQEKIMLEAVFKTTCKKCGTAGHLAQDCFQVPGGKKYELVTEDDKVTESVPQLADTSEESKKVERVTKKDKEHKHHKTSHRKKKRRHSSSSSDESEEESSKRKKHKKSKRNKP